MNFNPKAPPVYKPNAAKIGAPPVYSPQQSQAPGVQRKSARGLSLESRPAPPVYRPQQTTTPSAQLKPANNFKVDTRRAPVVYRQLPAESNLQLKTGSFPLAEHKGSVPVAKAKSSIQRTILQQTGFSKYRNPAEDFVNNRNSLGYTPPHINDLIVREGTSAVDVARAIKAPTIRVDQVREGEYTATVTDVPTNYVGYMMYLPMPGPWIAQATNISTTLAFLGVREDRLNFQIQRLEVEITGHDYKHETLSTEVEKHEKVHAADILRLKEEYFVPWDKKLTEAKDKRIPFTGATAEEAVQKLYDYAGGTPEKIAVEFFQATEKASRDFHKTAKGKTESFPSNLEPLKGINSYRLVSRWRHPV